jgi:hypothetical protein
MLARAHLASPGSENHTQFRADLGELVIVRNDKYEDIQVSDENSLEKPRTTSAQVLKYSRSNDITMTTRNTPFPYSGKSSQVYRFRATDLNLTRSRSSYATF